MNNLQNTERPKLRGAEKLARIPVKIEPTTNETRLRKPDWIRIKLPLNNSVQKLKSMFAEKKTLYRL